MNPNTRSVLRASLFAILLAGSFSLPSRADGITPERALLGHNDSRVAAWVQKSLTVSFDDDDTPGIDGEGALLNRRVVPEDFGADRSRTAQADLSPAASHDGAAALLTHSI
jgi:hypothetical protein